MPEPNAWGEYVRLRYGSNARRTKNPSALAVGSVNVTETSIGKTWVKSLQKYVDTNAFVIVYSATGVHVFPENTYKFGQR